MHAPLYRTPLYLNAERVLRLCPLDVEQADAIGVIGVLLGGVPETRRFSAGVDDHDALEEASPEVKREWVEQTFQISSTNGKTPLDKGKRTRYGSAVHACLPVYLSAIWCQLA